MKRTIEIDDQLPDAIDSAFDDCVDAIKEYYRDDPLPESTIDLHDSLQDDFTSIFDSAVPVYTYQINCIWLVYGPELEEAYENAGIGENPRENDGMTAIYYLIEEKVTERLKEWLENQSDETDSDETSNA